MRITESITNFMLLWLEIYLDNICNLIHCPLAILTVYKEHIFTDLFPLFISSSTLPWRGREGLGHNVVIFLSAIVYVWLPCNWTLHQGLWLNPWLLAEFTWLYFSFGKSSHKRQSKIYVLINFAVIIQGLYAIKNSCTFFF